jgi:hypothetical protein
MTSCRLRNPGFSLLDFENNSKNIFVGEADEQQGEAGEAEEQQDAEKSDVEKDAAEVMEKADAEKGEKELGILSVMLFRMQMTLPMMSLNGPGIDTHSLGIDST